MHHRLIAKLTYANVVATVACFLALGGTTYAATALPAHSVGAHQLKSNAVTSPKVKNHSLLAKDFKAGQLPQGAPGPQGPQGPGAIGVNVTVSSDNTGPQPVGGFGQWHLAVTCATTGANAVLTIIGPGTIVSTTSIAIGNSVAQTFVGTPSSIGAGASAAVDTGAQLSQVAFLRSASLYQFSYVLSATNSGGIEHCQLYGVAVPGVLGG
jgi:hypothetical protein